MFKCKDWSHPAGGLWVNILLRKMGVMIIKGVFPIQGCCKGIILHLNSTAHMVSANEMFTVAF